ncbi:hypothetical protein FQN55_009328 [Onygenales sp. PD_40]|nr:hypothetical protein FQN55_009328 [Onygenales sp. PD_40]
MVKLNYTGRKVQGVKVGQAVSKDLKKRIPPGTGARAAARDPHVEIDLTGKELTDDGFASFVGDLINCIQYRDGDHPNGTVRLTELVLKGNKLTVASMKMLGAVVALSGDCLTYLDVSENCISVASRLEREVWKGFLEAFQGCYHLKKIDISGNPLGGGGFDVFARVYTQSDLDFVEPLANGGSNDHADASGMAEINASLKSVNLGSGKENRKPVGNGTATSRNEGNHQDVLKPLGVHIDKEVQPADDSHYASARGLRSVPYLVFSNACTTNACAFHLWNITLSHREPDKLLQFLPPGKSMAPADHLNADNGIIYTPCEGLHALGKRLLELGGEYRMKISEIDADETEVLDPDQELEESEITRQRQLRKKHEIEMERVKNRLLLDVIKTDGVTSVDLWIVSFKMMRVARAILLDDKDKPKPYVPADETNIPEEPFPTIMEPYPAIFDPDGDGFTEDFPTIQEALSYPNGVSALSTVETPTKHKTQPRRTSAASRNVASNRRDSTATAKKVVPNAGSKEVGRFGLPMDLWRRIIADAMGATEILNVEQQMNVLRYASDWRAIKQELRIRGGTEYEQIWKILSSMGCLSYAHH